jgi:glycosyltransferase involved in cell wall biosynthesis
VPTRNPDALARAIGQLVSLSPEARRALGEACRARVTAEFGIERLVERTEHVLVALGQD